MEEEPLLPTIRLERGTSHKTLMKHIGPFVWIIRLASVTCFGAVLSLLATPGGDSVEAYCIPPAFCLYAVFNVSYIKLFILAIVFLPYTIIAAYDVYRLQPPFYGRHPLHIWGRGFLDIVGEAQKHPYLNLFPSQKKIDPRFLLDMLKEHTPFLYPIHIPTNPPPHPDLLVIDLDTARLAIPKGMQLPQVDVEPFEMEKRIRLLVAFTSIIILLTASFVIWRLYGKDLNAIEIPPEGTEPIVARNSDLARAANMVQLEEAVFEIRPDPHRPGHRIVDPRRPNSPPVVIDQDNHPRLMDIYINSRLERYDREDFRPYTPFDGAGMTLGQGDDIPPPQRPPPPPPPPPGNEGQRSPP